ncbi:MAG: endo-1,4-beta-xylanase [Lachnospiraceae bacterium]|nr:endo-1,4-beta-xylanase [Lachnospiraceae bacterium]
MNKKRTFGLLLSLCLVIGLIAGVGAKKAVAAETNLITNGCFDEKTDLSEWSAHQNGATITAEKSETPVVGNIKTYGKITNRTNNYQCFAQDVSKQVENGKNYRFVFYVMLDAEDYKNAPANQRTVEISPHIRVDGVDNYSQFVGGQVSQVLEPGVWTKFEGSFGPYWNGNLEALNIRLLEQGTDYGQGAGVMGTYYVTGVRLYEAENKATKVENNIPDLCEAIQTNLGDDDFIVGLAICGSDIGDVNTMGLVYKHANATTLGNELKPDAMFGYSNGAVPGKHTIEYQGEPLDVPKLDYSRAEKILNRIYDWNKNNPEHMIKVRGHVLVWHSQTPNWWFYEDYDPKGKLASPELMNRRLEWYIQTMAEHFTGPDSKYNGMFYGWDVVNEAVSDSRATYRNDAENSMWWKVYQSNEFIINAFKYANKYMDPSVDLYYNDYGDSSWQKSRGIVKLLEDVKAAEGTRIDGFGMQAHYSTADSPTISDFKLCAKAYAKVVDKVMLTEFDLSTNTFDGSALSRSTEYKKQSLRFRAFYDAIKLLREEGVNICGITWWGVTDPGSWLQTQSNVGGASGSGKQLPLLFDGDYKAKLAFWALVDQTKFEEGYKALNTPTPVPTATNTPTPTPTEAPAATETPAVTEAPAVTETPEMSPVPEVTEAAAAEETEEEGRHINYGALTAVVVLLLAGASSYTVAQKKKKEKNDQ